MPIRQYLRRRFQDLMMFIERLLKLLILYFEQQNVVEITEQTAIEHDDREVNFPPGWSKIRQSIPITLSVIYFIYDVNPCL